MAALPVQGRRDAPFGRTTHIVLTDTCIGISRGPALCGVEILGKSETSAAEGPAGPIGHGDHGMHVWVFQACCCPVGPLIVLRGAPDCQPAVDLPNGALQPLLFSSCEQDFVSREYFSMFLGLRFHLLDTSCMCKPRCSFHSMW